MSRLSRGTNIISTRSGCQPPLEQIKLLDRVSEFLPVRNAENFVRIMAYIPPTPNHGTNPCVLNPSHSP